MFPFQSEQSSFSTPPSQMSIKKSRVTPLIAITAPQRRSAGESHRYRHRKLQQESHCKRKLRKAKGPSRKKRTKAEVTRDGHEIPDRGLVGNKRLRLAEDELVGKSYDREKAVMNSS